jgi:hypothetical protein
MRAREAASRTILPADTGHGSWAYPEPADCVRIAFFSTSLIGKMKIYLGKPVRVGDKKLTFAPF